MKIKNQIAIFAMVFIVYLLPTVEPGIMFFSKENFEGDSLHLLPIFVGCLNMPDGWPNRTRSIITDIPVILYIRPWCRVAGWDPIIAIHRGMYPRLDEIKYREPYTGNFFPLILDNRIQISSMNDAWNEPNWKQYPGLLSRRLDLDLEDSDEMEDDFGIM